MKLSKRALRCLKRIDSNKSIPDIGALDELETKGAITCKAESSDDIDIRITEKGREALKQTEEMR